MYGFDCRYAGSFSDAVQRVTDELKKEGFGVLTEIDVQATMKAKLGIDRRPYKILGACNPQLANRAIEADPDVGLLLPCNVVVREDEQGVVVSFMDPAAVLAIADRPELATLGEDVRARLLRVRDAMTA